MALRAKWSVRVEGLETRLTIGGLDPQGQARPVRVSLLINGLAPVEPGELTDCLDYAPICDWIVHQWPGSARTRFLETRVNEVLAFVFASDKRVQDVWVGLFLPGEPQAARVGVERQSTRRQFEEQMRSVSDRAKRRRTPTPANAVARRVSVRR